MSRPIGRRDFLRMTAAVTSSSTTGFSVPAIAAERKPKLRKTVKYPMVKLDGNWPEIVRVLNEIGYEGLGHSQFTAATRTG